ncbi:MAG: M67 family metallopeptidase [Nitrospinota bacterium]|nr:M67 family metallopeptidase [Nitrospinota bacterium]
MRLLRKQTDLIFSHAESNYPDECCGLIVGPKGEDSDLGDFEIILCRNIQNDMHKLDPETYPRTARTAFLIEPKEFLRIDNSAKEGKVLKAIFHSHPDEESYFSDEDKRAAVPFGDIPTFPDANHVVISIRQNEVKETKVFAWDQGKKNFVQRVFNVVDD